MKILCLNGSPRRGGNTDILLGRFTDGAKSEGAYIETIIINEKKILPCAEIYYCRKNGNCVINDDMKDIFEELISEDIVVLASPIFFYHVSAYAKALIDRCQSLWVRKYELNQDIPFKGRKGVFFSVAASKGKRLFDGAKLTVRYFFDVIGVEYAAELLVRGVDLKGEILQHPSALQEAYELGKKMAIGSAKV